MVRLTPIGAVPNTLLSAELPVAALPERWPCPVSEKGSVGAPPPAHVHTLVQVVTISDFVFELPESADMLHWLLVMLSVQLPSVPLTVPVKLVWLYACARAVWERQSVAAQMAAQMNIEKCFFG